MSARARSLDANVSKVKTKNYNTQQHIYFEGHVGAGGLEPIPADMSERRGAS